MVKVNTGYAPHQHQADIHRRMMAHRFAVLVCHRRFGKTVLAINSLIDAALRFEGGDGRLAYVAPYLKQAKQIAWDYLKKYTNMLPGVLYNESELYAGLPNGARIRLYGADNADAMRGLYFDGVVMTAEAKEAAKIEKAWAKITAVRAASNQLEAKITDETCTCNAHDWPD